jgi:hypothetical protein
MKYIAYPEIAQSLFCGIGSGHLLVVFSSTGFA